VVVVEAVEWGVRDGLGGGKACVREGATHTPKAQAKEQNEDDKKECKCRSVPNQFDEARRWLATQCDFWQQLSRAVGGMKQSDNGMIRWASLCSVGSNVDGA
jgi:hypothetical protein